MRRIKHLILILSLSLAGSIGAQTGKDVDAATFKKMMANKNAVIIDLRTPEEIKSKGKIEGAMEIDFLANDAERKDQFCPGLLWVFVHTTQII